MKISSKNKKIELFDFLVKIEVDEKKNKMQQAIISNSKTPYERVKNYFNHNRLHSIKNEEIFKDVIDVNVKNEGVLEINISKKIKKYIKKEISDNDVYYYVYVYNPNTSEMFRVALLPIVAQDCYYLNPLFLHLEELKVNADYSRRK
jgi:hypothetical protein